MKKRNGLIALLLGTAVLGTMAGCQSARQNAQEHATVALSADMAKNAYEDAHATLKSGVTTYDEMVKKYGTPKDKVATEAGFACHWEQKLTMMKTMGTRPNSMASFDEGSVGGLYRHITTFVSEMEAFFSADGKLINFRLSSDMK